MLKKLTSILTIFSLLIALSWPPVRAGAASKPLPAPQGVTVSTEGTYFIINWQNPSGIPELAQSSYVNYIGTLNYIIDWRVDGGAWHYDKEVPDDQDILDVYPDINLQFCGMVYDAGRSGKIISQAVVDKVLVGIPYSSTISEWLKTNNVEFRIRYIYGYWDDNEGTLKVEHSPFSTPVLLGTNSPTGNPGNGPGTGEFGVPDMPDSIEAPIDLVSEYMTLNLRWKEPESIKTLVTMGRPVDAIIDWKLNDGEWHDGRKVFEDTLDISLVKRAENLVPDKYDYVTADMNRPALDIPYGIPLSTWLADKTYYFRVRYAFSDFQDDGTTKEIESPYSNIATLGRGASAPNAPQLEAPSGLAAKVKYEYGEPVVYFTWTVPDSVSEANKDFRVAAFLDIKPEGGKWLTEQEGLDRAYSATGDLRDNSYEIMSSQPLGVYSFRVLFGCEYKPGTYAYSGFSNVVTVDTGKEEFDATLGGRAERLWGDDRYKTASAISKKGWFRSDSVVLASGENFPDALVGSSFSYLKDAPMLITSPDSLNSDTKAEIKRLGAKTIYVIGSYESISKAVEDELKQNYTVVRIGGAGVFDTAVKVAQEVRKIKEFRTAAIATQNDFPDALAIAPFSARDTMPILFSEKDKLRPDTKKALQDWGINQVFISGGPGVVSSAVENELKAMGITVERLWGDDRYTTALEVAKRFSDQHGYYNITIATGLNYPDALTGAVLAARNNAPIFLTDKDSLTSDVLDYINMQSISKVYIFGGNGVVSDSILSRIGK